MKNVLEKMFYEYIKEAANSNFIEEAEDRLEDNKKLLEVHLNEGQKKLLLRVIDDKDLITEKTNLNSFIYGFKTGLKFGYEVNQD